MVHDFDLDQFKDPRLLTIVVTESDDGTVGDMEMYVSTCLPLGTVVKVLHDLLMQVAGQFLAEESNSLN